MRINLFEIEDEEEKGACLDPFKLSPKLAVDDGLSLKLSKWIKGKISEADHSHLSSNI